MVTSVTRRLLINGRLRLRCGEGTVFFNWKTAVGPAKDDLHSCTLQRIRPYQNIGRNTQPAL